MILKKFQKLRVGASLEVRGKVIESPAKGQAFEIHILDWKLLGDCPENYPIQPKRHTREFLREQAYLRPRTICLVRYFVVRSVTAMAIHDIFKVIIILCSYSFNHNSRL